MGSEIKSLEHPTLKVSRPLDNNTEIIKNQAVLSVEIELFFVLKIFIEKLMIKEVSIDVHRKLKLLCLLMTGSLTTVLISLLLGSI
jgi:hypothetical protein